jgi:hypothetical protein
MSRPEAFCPLLRCFTVDMVEIAKRVRTAVSRRIRLGPESVCPSPPIKMDNEIIRHSLAQNRPNRTDGGSGDPSRDVVMLLL